MNPRARALQHLDWNPIIHIIEGPDKGAMYQVVSEKISIGRSDDNDIVLSDPRVSRRHVVIEISPEQILVKDNGSQNGIIVNGQVTRKMIVEPGAILSIGNTHIKIEGAQGSGSQSPNLSIANSPEDFMVQQPGAPIGQSDSAEVLPSKANKKIFIYLFLIGTLLYLILSEPNSTPNIEEEFTTDVVREKEIESIKNHQEELLRNRAASGKDTYQYKQAQSHFIRGFRDYREGNYQRSMIEFSSALSLYPNHVLANKYYRLAQRRLDELIQESMSAGKRALEQNRYKLARSSFKNVLILVNDPKSKVYQEAEERIKEINIILKGSY